MTGKTDGTNTWTYTWDDDNRLTRVQGPGGVDVAYEYDSQGRMLTRDDGTTVTSFTWDGWNCVREDDGTNVFRYYSPQGELLSFERNSTFYQVHTDALGSVRAITDNTGAVVGSYTYGAWGEILSASEPSVFTMPFKWIGGLGVRHDPASGLYYMRNRWYDGLGLQRFLSRDPLSDANLYQYAKCQPTGLIDPFGLKTTQQKYEEIYSKYIKIPRSKRNCHVFFSMLREVADKSDNIKQFLRISQALTVPNSALPYYESGPQRATNRYWRRWRIPYQHQISPGVWDFVEFPQGDWNPALQDSLDPRPETEQGHHLMFNILTGYRIPNTYGITLLELILSETREGQGSNKTNYNDIYLGEIGQAFGHELAFLGTSSCKSKKFKKWLDDLEKLVCGD